MKTEERREETNTKTENIVQSELFCAQNNAAEKLMREVLLCAERH